MAFQKTFVTKLKHYKYKFTINCKFDEFDIHFVGALEAISFIQNTSKLINY